MKSVLQILTVLYSFFYAIQLKADSDPYRVELEQISIPGSPLLHSFAFAQSEGKWLMIGGRINGLHGFNAVNSFPKQYFNVNIYVVDPVTKQVWSRNIFSDLPLSIADQLRSTNMQSVQIGNKLYLAGGYGYDSTTNSLLTYPLLKVIDVSETIIAVMNGASVSSFIRQATDSRLQVTGGELRKLGDYFYLVGGHKFTGTYRRLVNNQTYTNQIKKFKINDDGFSISVSDYISFTDTAEYHRRDMNVVPAIKPDGITPYLILNGGVFRYNRDIPFLNPVYIEAGGIYVDHSFEQKMSQYTCPYMPVYDSISKKMHTTFFGGISLYYCDAVTDSMVYDSLVPFIKDITTITKSEDGTTDEKVLSVKFPDLLGSNAQFIMNEAVPHFENGVIKLNELPGRTFAGYIFGGIRALMPNNGESFPSEYIFKVYITPDKPLPVELLSFTSSINNRSVLLKWSTAFENNNFGFEVERKSISNENIFEWINIASIRGAGNSKNLQNYTYKDNDLNCGRFLYRLKQLDYNGNFEYYNLTDQIVVDPPDRYFLSQNYPNPFNPVTKISYEISVPNKVSLKVYDALGNTITTLVNEKQDAGYYSVQFTGQNLSSGIYFYKLVSGNFSETKRMILIK